MMKKLIPAICLFAFLVFVGCEATDSGESSYTFSTNATVNSISEPVEGKDGDLAKIVTSDTNFVVMVTEGVNLQRMKTDNTGLVNISVDQYTIIVPGDGIQFAWVADQIDYASRPPIVRPDTIVILK